MYCSKIDGLQAPVETIAPGINGDVYLVPGPPALAVQIQMKTLGQSWLKGNLGWTHTDLIFNHSPRVGPNLKCTGIWCQIKTMRFFAPIPEIMPADQCSARLWNKHLMSHVMFRKGPFVIVWRKQNSGERKPAISSDKMSALAKPVCAGQQWRKNARLFGARI